MSEYAVILFRSAGHSLRAARSLKKAGIELAMVPIPRSLDADCGYCVRIPGGDAPAAREVLAQAGIEFTRIEELRESALAFGAEAPGITESI